MKKYDKFKLVVKITEAHM